MSDEELKIKYYTTLKDVWFKFLSNVVSMKAWIFVIATILLFEGLINQWVWLTVLGSIYGIGKAIKWQYLRTLGDQESVEEETTTL